MLKISILAVLLTSSTAFAETKEMRGCLWRLNEAGNYWTKEDPTCQPDRSGIGDRGDVPFSKPLPLPPVDDGDDDEDPEEPEDPEDPEEPEDPEDPGEGDDEGGNCGNGQGNGGGNGTDDEGKGND